MSTVSAFHGTRCMPTYLVCCGRGRHDDRRKSSDTTCVRSFQPDRIAPCYLSKLSQPECIYDGLSSTARRHGRGFDYVSRSPPSFLCLRRRSCPDCFFDACDDEQYLIIKVLSGRYGESAWDFAATSSVFTVISFSYPRHAPPACSPSTFGGAHPVLLESVGLPPVVVGRD